MTSNQRNQIKAEAKRDAALFADEFPGEVLDPAATKSLLVGHRFGPWVAMGAGAEEVVKEVDRLRTATRLASERANIYRLAITTAASILHESFARPGREVASAAGKARRVLLEALGERMSK